VAVLYLMKVRIVVLSCVEPCYGSELTSIPGLLMLRAFVIVHATCTNTAQECYTRNFTRLRERCPTCHENRLTNALLRSLMRNINQENGDPVQREYTC
ncbi:Hypothetical protein GSB_152002, partial [Giardia duodenalis]